jgi:CrcB protein
MEIATPDLSTPIAIAAGAIVGALGRYYLTLAWRRCQGGRFPYGTLFVNLTGALLIGAIAGSLGRWVVLSSSGQSLVLTGLLGSYTTFSSYILDAVNLWQAGRRTLAIAYWLGSVVLGLGLAELGLWLTH